MPDLRLLLVRPADLLVLELRLVAVELLDPGTARMRARLGADSSVDLVLPPQAVLETAASERGVDRILSGPSRLRLAWPAGIDLPLGRDAFLRAIGGAALHPSPLVESGATLVEAPWGLLMSPVDARLGDGPSPSFAEDGTAGVWRLDVGDADTGWRIVASRDDPTALVGGMPLRGSRKLLELASQATPATGAIRLGAVGATARLALDGTSEQWRHEIALGRDQAVTLTRRGMVYPWGWRAIQTVSWVRAALPLGDGSISALRLATQRITLLERSARVERPNFPFDRVGTDVSVIDFAGKLHVTEQEFAFKGPVAAEVAQRRADVDERTAALNRRLGELPRNVEGMIAQGFASGAQLADARAAALAAADELAQANEIIAEIDRQIGPLQDRLDQINREMPGADEATIGALSAEASQIAAEIANLLHGMPDRSAMAVLRDRAKATEAERRRAAAICEAELATIPRNIAALRAAGDGEVAALDAVAAHLAEAETRLAALTATLAAAAEISFMPADAAGAPILLPLRFGDDRQRLDTRMPCLFVGDVTLTQALHGVDYHSLDDPATLAALARSWSTHRTIHPGDVALDLVRRPPVQPGDVHQLRRCDVIGAWQDGRYAPGLDAIEVRMPALAMAVPGTPDAALLAFAPDDRDAPLRLDPPLTVSFDNAGERAGGLAVPRYDVDAIARDSGPVPLAARAGATAGEAARIFGATKLLGYGLADLVAAGRAVVPAPRVTPTATGATFEWNDVRPGSFAGFTAHPGCALTLTSTVDGGMVRTAATLTDFELSLPPGAPLVDVRFAALTCTIEGAGAPRIALDGLALTFRNELSLLEDLRRRVGEALAATGSGIVLDQLPNGVRAGYRVRLPDVASGAFLLRGIEAAVLVTIPFDGTPVEVELAFARPDNPFALSVLVFGGGGYVTATLRAGKLAKLDISLHFGAMVGVDFRIASAQVSAIGGLRLTGGEDGYSFEAFLRFSGQIELLGIVSVSVSLRLLLSYREDRTVTPGRRLLIGRATLVLEVDVLFLSKSLELDSGEWVIEGSAIADAAPHTFGAPRTSAAVTSMPGAAARRLRASDPAERARVDSSTAAAWAAYREAFEA